MKLLYGYLKPYKWLIALTMLLATINTIFSLIDPIIFGKIIKLSQDINTRQEDGNPFGWDAFFSATILLLLMSMGTAMVSRIAKKPARLFRKCGDPKVWGQDLHGRFAACHETPLSGI